MHRLNLVTALVSFAASCVLLAVGQVPTALIWMAASVVWLAVGIARLKSPARDPHPVRSALRRVSRLAMWS